MTELQESIALANKILDRTNADPDDDLAMLSRQFLRSRESIKRMEKQLKEVDWDGQAQEDLIHANRDTILDIHKEALRRIKSLIAYLPNEGKLVLIAEIIKAVNTFHPMHAESWKGFPEGE